MKKVIGTPVKQFDIPHELRQEFSQCSMVHKDPVDRRDLYCYGCYYVFRNQRGIERKLDLICERIRRVYNLNCRWIFVEQGIGKNEYHLQIVNEFGNKIWSHIDLRRQVGNGRTW